ncbi:MAG: nucleotidyltransferase domain-containing protein [Candidatus Hodarchaeota archaeon]
MCFFPREKVVRNIEQQYHDYTEEEKQILSELRERALEILHTLENNSIHAFVHGSIARGDISQTSDIDIYIPIKVPSYQIDLVDEFAKADRQIIMGTPNSVIKAVLTKHDGVSISFPLSQPKERESEFYKFSGLLYLEDLLQERRIAGVNKKLLLIEPEGEGYWKSSVHANRKRTIEILGLSQRIIDERIRVLERRDIIGRTGMFLDYNLHPNENFDQALKKISDRNVIVRRVLNR